MLPKFISTSLCCLIISFILPSQSISIKNSPELYVKNISDADQDQSLQSRAFIQFPGDRFVINNRGLTQQQQKQLLENIRLQQSLQYQPVDSSAENRERALLIANGYNFNPVIFNPASGNRYNIPSNSFISPLPSPLTQEGFAPSRANIQYPPDFVPGPRNPILEDIVKFQQNSGRKIQQPSFTNIAGMKDPSRDVIKYVQAPNLIPKGKLQVIELPLRNRTVDLSNLLSSGNRVNLGISHLANADSVATTTDNRIIKEIYLKSNPEQLITKDRQKFFQQFLEKENDNFLSANLGNQNNLPGANAGNQINFVGANGNQNLGKSHLEKELLRQLQLQAANSEQNLAPSSNDISEITLPDGQVVQISKDYQKLLSEESADGAGGVKTLVVKPTVAEAPSQIKPPEAVVEELTKGVLPPGADFEVIRPNKDGGLEPVKNFPQNLPQKKVTFVILEEQPDGSVRVQGVRGSEKESLKESSEEIGTIIRKLQDGQLTLPPSSRFPSGNKLESPSSGSKQEGSRHSSSGTQQEGSRYSSSGNKQEGSRYISNGNKPELSRQSSTPTPVNAIPDLSTSFLKKSTLLYPNKTKEDYLLTDLFKKFSQDASSKSKQAPSTENRFTKIPDYQKTEYVSEVSKEDFTNKISPTDSIPFSDSPKIETLENERFSDLLKEKGRNKQHSTYYPRNKQEDSTYYSTIDSNFISTTIAYDDTTESKYVDNFVTSKPYQGSHSTSDDLFLPTTPGSGQYFGSRKTESPPRNVDQDTEKPQKGNARKTPKRPGDQEYRESQEAEAKLEDQSQEPAEVQNGTLSDILKKNGFYAMAKFLRQSGLDTILNDTSPFTIFVPTDKAFRSLLIQLGGPDRAEEKFKENPRLLSGLLLHHVIPGAFKVESLQDEMTGVSLAGTQLRVNAYTTHDIEWNDITIITINGARILEEKDIIVPQGVAHAVDRVMFPLPVGNMLQSLQADRDSRFSNFIKVVETSNLASLLTGSRTFTLFAPLNRAFTSSEFDRISTNSTEAKSFLLKHLTPGALYSAGMKYYQLRDSLEEGHQITLYKEAGRIKANTAHVVSRNIPTTNGVIHAIDAFL